MQHSGVGEQRRYVGRTMQVSPASRQLCSVAVRGVRMDVLVNNEEWGSHILRWLIESLHWSREANNRRIEQKEILLGGGEGCMA